MINILRMKKFKFLTVREREKIELTMRCCSRLGGTAVNTILRVRNSMGEVCEFKSNGLAMLIF